MYYTYVKTVVQSQSLANWFSMQRKDTKSRNTNHTVNYHCNPSNNQSTTDWLCLLYYIRV